MCNSQTEYCYGPCTVSSFKRYLRSSLFYRKNQTYPAKHGNSGFFSHIFFSCLLFHLHILLCLALVPVHLLSLVWHELVQPLEVVLGEQPGVGVVHRLAHAHQREHLVQNKHLLFTFCRGSTVLVLNCLTSNLGNLCYLSNLTLSHFSKKFFSP